MTTSNPLRAATHTKEVSRSTGRTYYVDKATLETRWDHPGEHAVIADETEAQQPEEVPAQHGRRQAKRAATHTKEVSRSTGRTYYVDEATLESTWDHPGEHAVVADVTAALVTMSANPMACERDAAPSPEKRVATDGTSYTKDEFIAHYGTTEWDDAHAI